MRVMLIARIPCVLFKVEAGNDSQWLLASISGRPLILGHWRKRKGPADEGGA